MDSEEAQFGYVDSVGSSNTPESTGFNSKATSSGTKGSKESLSDRFKRYIRRILPGGGSKSSKKPQQKSSTSSSSHGSPPEPHHHHHHHHHPDQPGVKKDVSTSKSKSMSGEKTASEPFDPNASYGQAYKTKHPRASEQSGYAASERNSDDTSASDYDDGYVDDDDDNEDDEDIEDEDEDEELNDEDAESQDSHGLSNNFRYDRDDGRRSASSRTQSRSGSRGRSGSRTRNRSRSRSRARSRSRSPARLRSSSRSRSSGGRR